MARVLPVLGTLRKLVSHGGVWQWETQILLLTSLLVEAAIGLAFLG